MRIAASPFFILSWYFLLTVQIKRNRIESKEKAKGK